MSDGAIQFTAEQLEETDGAILFSEWGALNKIPLIKPYKYEATLMITTTDGVILKVDGSTSNKKNKKECLKILHMLFKEKMKHYKKTTKLK